MPEILCVVPGKAYLPEIDAYQRYFRENGLGFDVVNASDVKDAHFSRYDVLWSFMGLLACHHRETLNVQEFASLSCGFLPTVKDKVKRVVNKQPDAYVVLNKQVAFRLGLIKSSVPVFYRDMGVDTSFFSYGSCGDVKYDFCYLGAMDPSRQLTKILNKFRHGALKAKSLLLIGEPPKELYANYHSCSNIAFCGRVLYADVPSYLMQSRMGLNFVPSIYPYYIQTSTKLLEYCAVGLDIVSNDYEWVRGFMADNQGQFCLFDEHKVSLLKSTDIDNFPYITPDISHMTWNNVLAQSGILAFLKSQLGMEGR